MSRAMEFLKWNLTYFAQDNCAYIVCLCGQNIARVQLGRSTFFMKPISTIVELDDGTLARSSYVYWHRKKQFDWNFQSGKSYGFEILCRQCKEQVLIEHAQLHKKFEAYFVRFPDQKENLSSLYRDWIILQSSFHDVSLLLQIVRSRRISREIPSIEKLYQARINGDRVIEEAFLNTFKKLKSEISDSLDSVSY